VNYYTVQRPTELVGPGTITAVTVSCEDGDRVVSGGYVHTKDQPNLQVSGSAPTGERGWLVQVQNFSETLSYELVLYARCERLTPQSRSAGLATRAWSPRTRLAPTRAAARRDG